LLILKDLYVHEKSKNLSLRLKLANDGGQNNTISVGKYLNTLVFKYCVWYLKQYLNTTRKSSI